MSANKFGAIIVGAGAVGLSVASTLAKRSNISGSCLLLERHRQIGQETSSRSSEVIHASVYYPPNTLKAQLCAEGNKLMYEMCERYQIPHMNNGKLLIAKSKDDLKLLSKVLEVAKASGGQGVRIVDEAEIRDLEPKVVSPGAVYCPTSGVVDSHSLMEHYEWQFLEHGGELVYNSEVTGIEKINGGRDGYRVEVTDVNLGGQEPVYGSKTTVETKYIINCAGIMSSHIAKLAGISSPEYDIHPTKGMYFRVHRKLDQFPEMLIYPLPDTSIVGIHTCPDVWGGMRLGPYEQWFPDEEIGHINNLEDHSYYGSRVFDLTTPEELGPFFLESVKPFLPFLELEDISPCGAAIHPKLQNKGQPLKDWIIQHEAKNGLPNFINLVGIESPGLTSSPAIGRYVADMVDSIN